MDVTALRRGLLAGMAGSGLPSNIYHGFFTPSDNVRTITIDTGLTDLDDNESIVLGIITHDLMYSQSGYPNYYNIIQVAFLKNKVRTAGYSYGVLSNGTNDYVSVSATISNGSITITPQAGSFVKDCKYEVVAMA